MEVKVLGVDMAAKPDETVYSAWDRDGFKPISKEEYDFWMRHKLPFGCALFPATTNQEGE